MPTPLNIAVEGSVDDGDHLTCFCGPSWHVSNPNSLVTYEGNKILVEGCVFDAHPKIVIVGTVDCCTSPSPHGRSPEAESFIGNPQLGLVTINGLKPIRFNDLFPCGSKVAQETLNEA